MRQPNHHKFRLIDCSSKYRDRIFAVCRVLFCALWHREQWSELAHVLDPKAEDHVRSREADRDQATERAEKEVPDALGRDLEGRDRNLEAPRVLDPSRSKNLFKEATDAKSQNILYHGVWK